MCRDFYSGNTVKKANTSQNVIFFQSICLLNSYLYVVNFRMTDPYQSILASFKRCASSFVIFYPFYDIFV